MHVTDLITLRSDDGGTLLTVAESLTVNDAHALYDRACESADKTGAIRVVLNERVEHLHGSAVQVLLSLKKTCDHQGRLFTVSGSTGVLRDMLRVVGLNTN